MLFGDPVWVDELLSCIVARVVSETGYPQDVVFPSLASDEDHCRFPPADRFVTVTPASFPVDGPGVTGGGKLLTGFDGRIRVTLIQRYASDQELRDARRLTEEANNILAEWKRVLDALQMFAPARTDAGPAVLREPMRVVGFDVRPRRVEQAWAVLGSEWSIRFTSPLSAM